MKTSTGAFPILVLAGLLSAYQVQAEESEESPLATESEDVAATDEEAETTDAEPEEEPRPEVLTVPDILNFLVREGVVTKEQAEELVAEAGVKSRGRVGAAVDVVKELDKEHKKVMDPSIVRVPYIPQYLKDEIRDQVQIGLKEDVVRDVMGQAKTEAWGVPGTMPTWTKRIKLSGDFRARYQGDIFSDGNDGFFYRDYNKVNSAGRELSATNEFDLNTQEDRHRLRARARIAIKAKVTEGINFKARLASGSRTDPLSTNETFEAYDGSYEISFDQAYLKFENLSKSDQFYIGKMSTPFAGTDLMWDSDLKLDGIANRWWFFRSEDNDEEIYFDPYVSAGIYSLDEINLESKDKWLYAVQTGFNWSTYSQNIFSVSLAYYHYENVTGELNAPFSIENDYTVPEYFQKGNTVFNINSDDDPDTVLYALASEFRNVGLNATADFTFFAPIHIYVTADYFVNIGYDREEIDAKLVSEDVDSDEDTAYQLKFKIGWPKLAKRRDWQASLIYRYVEADAFIDAFTDSDFHLGGTDGKGTIIKGSYAFRENTWITVSWISTNEIKRAPLGIDTLQVDLNTKF